mgnify:CR=1 FL=1
MSPKLKPDDTTNEIYVTPGSDVTIYFATIHPRERYGNSKLTLTALLNYRPVEARYEHYDSRRSQVLDKTKGRNAVFPIDGPIEIVDVTIPSNVFNGKGTYDIGFGWGSSGPVDYAAGWERIHVHYGSCAPATHPCMERAKVARINKDERTIAEKYLAGSYVYPDGRHASRGPFEDIEVEGGREVTIGYSVHSGESKTSYVVVPLINETPIPRRRYIYAPADPTKAGIYVKGRGEFKLTIPDRPGEYSVELAKWDMPFLRPGEPTDSGLKPVGHLLGSNSVTYVVKE